MSFLKEVGGVWARGKATPPRGSLSESMAVPPLVCGSGQAAAAATPQLKSTASACAFLCLRAVAHRGLMSLNRPCCVRKGFVPSTSSVAHLRNTIMDLFFFKLKIIRQCQGPKIPLL